MVEYESGSEVEDVKQLAFFYDYDGIVWRWGAIICFLYGRLRYFTSISISNRVILETEIQLT